MKRNVFAAVAASVLIVLSAGQATAGPAPFPEPKPRVPAYLRHCEHLRKEAQMISYYKCVNTAIRHGKPVHYYIVKKR